jgi:hypothetical protein
MIRELDSRTTGATTVVLVWDSETNQTAIMLFGDSPDGIGIPVPREKALDAFAHPFCYLPELPDDVKQTLAVK